MASKTLRPVDHLFSNGSVVDAYTAEAFSVTTSPTSAPVASAKVVAGGSGGSSVTFDELDDNRRYVAAQKGADGWRKLQFTTPRHLSRAEQVLLHRDDYPAPDVGAAIKAGDPDAPRLGGSSHIFPAGSKVEIYRASAFTDGHGPLGPDSKPLARLTVPADGKIAIGRHTGLEPGPHVAVQGSGDNRRFVQFTVPRPASNLESVLQKGR